MNRRAFLASLAGAFAIDPERLLWVPGAKLISIPAPRVCHRLLTGTPVVNCTGTSPLREFIDVLRKNRKFTNLFSAHYDAVYGKS